MTLGYDRPSATWRRRSAEAAHMTRFILRRLIQAVLTLFGITILTFTLVRLAPGDPVSLMVAGTAEMTAADLAAMRAAYGVDEPIPQQYLSWLGRLLDRRPRPVAALQAAGRPDDRRDLAEHPPALRRWRCWSPCWSGCRSGRWRPSGGARCVDQAIRVAQRGRPRRPAVLARPAVRPDLRRPASVLPGRRDADDRGERLGPRRPAGAPRRAGPDPRAWPASRTTPATSVPRCWTCWPRTTSGRPARRGCTRRAVALTHVLRNALLPVVTALGGILATLVSGSLVVEQVFAWPGMGRSDLRGGPREGLPGHHGRGACSPARCCC